MTNRVTDRAFWRDDTVWHGIQWSQIRNGYRALEMRHDAESNTTARPICSIRRYLDGYTATCMGCGREFDVEQEAQLQWLGSSPEGICCCSPECHDRYEEDAGCWCSGCGVMRPQRLDVHGNHSCLLCASRALRAQYEAERRPTEPSPPPDFADLSADDGRRPNGLRDASGCHESPSTSAA